MSPPSHATLAPRCLVSSSPPLDVSLPPPPQPHRRCLKPHWRLFLNATDADDASPRSSQQPSRKNRVDSVHGGLDDVDRPVATRGDLGVAW
uniref:Uncharacterized protein n=1 Tax=Oryza punctata TaxID=4537 RepID=A0A0E0LCY1_ORYPU